MVPESEDRPDSSPPASGPFPVEVCYALPEGAMRVMVTAEAGWTIAQAIEASGLSQRFGQEPGKHRVGIYGKPKSPATLVRPGDRIEILRPLLADPKEARRRRAQKKKAQADAPGRRRDPASKP